jgi:acyl transferase domain-containing protein
VTGGFVEGPELDAGYWYRNLREPVQFDLAVQALRGNAFLEVSPHPVLTTAIEDDVVVGTLRRGDGGLPRLLRSLAELHVHGVPVDWTRAFDGVSAWTDLPTYPFEHQRFQARLAAPRAGHGTHPLLGPPVHLPGSGAVAFSSRFSTVTQPWLADHVVDGAVLLPGAAFADLVLAAGVEVGCRTLADLTLLAPLEVGADDVLLLVELGPVAADGRAVAVFAAQGDEWIRHAEGLLTVDLLPPDSRVDRRTPETAEDSSTLYTTLAAAGFRYGAAFQGVGQVWRDGDDVYAEIALDTAEAVAGYGVHPALLDAAVQVSALAGIEPGVPYSWSGVRVHRAGATAGRVRVRATGADRVALEVVDPDGEPIVSVDSLMLRPAGQRPRRVAWVPAPEQPSSGDQVVLAADPDPALPLPDRVYEVTTRVLTAVQDWLRDPGRDTATLVVRTENADVDPAAAAVWGLVRSAQAEHPGRFALVDTDADVPATAAPEVRVRAGQMFVPRLVPDDGPVAAPFRTTGTVLVTGGSGALAGIIARHLVTAYGVRDLVLASRSGAVAGLSDLPAHIRAERCDVTDRAAVAALVAGIPELTAVVHAAGVLDDGVVTALTPDRLAAVRRPKLDAAWYLHELTADRDLAEFVVFSSYTGTVGAAGQGSYAAANAALDALVEHRRALGLPARSIAWGLWDTATGMTEHLTGSHHRRIQRSGVVALTPEQGLRLFDAALASATPVLVAARLVDAVPVRRRGGAGFAGDSEREVLDLVRSTAAIVLGHDGNAVLDVDQPLQEFGLDSLTAVELRNRIATATGLRLPPTVVFDHPTVAGLARHVHSLLAPAKRPEATEAELFADLARIEAAFQSQELDDVARTGAVTRLRALLATLDTAWDDDSGDLLSASDDELFAFLDTDH